MIQINNISKQFSDQILFQDISFNIQPGERCGLIGRNGSGKSTIFSLILNKQSPDSGSISIPKGYKISTLEQHISFTKKTVLDECTQVLSAEFQYDYHKAEKILFGLGFTEDDLTKSPESFSGGFQIRINLCKALLTEPNLLLLDEPTNYLDILSLRWLRSFLRSFKGEVILITHDKSFMDSVTTHTMGIYRGQLKKIKGQTPKFHEQVVLEDEIYEKTRENNDKKRAHLEAFVERFSATASKATQAQSKQKQLDKMAQMDQIQAESTMSVKFNYQECPGKQIIEISDLAFGYPEQDILFRDLNFSIGRNDRIGIIGKNGKGKSTLLNVISGEFKPTTGVVKNHPSLNKGHFGQTNVERLSLENTVIEEIQSVNTDLANTAVRNICGSLMFGADLAKKKIKVLSGGEKNRVLLGKIIANPTNLLLLDEPTNHLDMESIESLKNEIIEYPGAAVIVTHNEELLREICDKLIIFHKGVAELFLGGYDEFLEKIGWEDEIQIEKTIDEDAPKRSKKEAHAMRSLIIKERSSAYSPIKKEIEKLETIIKGLEKEVEVQTKAIEEATTSGDNKKLHEASKRIGELESSLQINTESLETQEYKMMEQEEIFDLKLAEI
jgi:ATP-binding cassette subfamily F protein 3